MNSPMISVIMPVYNGEKYLIEAIESILNQTYKDFEFIILNDGSTDKTEEIILSYQDPRIVYVKNDENLQIVETLNKGIELAKGKYIARMDADDISLPDRFEKQINIFKKQSYIGAVFATVILIDTTGEILQNWEADQNCIEHTQFAKILPKMNCFAHPSLMIDASLLKEYQYNVFPKYAEDYNLWLRLFSDGVKFYKINEPLVYYRIHHTSTTQNTQTAVGAYTKGMKAKGKLLYDKIVRKNSFNSFDLSVLKFICIDHLKLLKTIIKQSLQQLIVSIRSFKR